MTAIRGGHELVPEAVLQGVKSVFIGRSFRDFV
jgi:hypothetical protein